MSKSKHKRNDYDDTEHYGRTPKLKEQTIKRAPRNWKKLLEKFDDEEE